MSYILDALKKSDQQRQRQRGATPTLADAPVSVDVSVHHQASNYVLLAIVIVVVGSVIRWSLPWLTEPAVDVVTTQPATTVRQDLQVSPPFYVETPALPVRESFVRDTQPAKPVAEMVDVAMAQSLTMARQEMQVSPPVYAEAAAQPVREALVPDAQPAKPAAAAEAIVRQPVSPAEETVQRVISLHELPSAIQRELPEMAVQLHAYSSKPAERLVSINAIRLREGGSLMLGLRLEEITPDGMIFSYKGYRFQRSIR